jgi:uncharacterized protein
MDNETFEWDDDKAEANWQKHGVAFEQAVIALSDAFANTCG